MSVFQSVRQSRQDACYLCTGCTSIAPEARAFDPYTPITPISSPQPVALLLKYLLLSQANFAPQDNSTQVSTTQMRTITYTLQDNDTCARCDLPSKAAAPASHVHHTRPENGKKPPTKDCNRGTCQPRDSQDSQHRSVPGAIWSLGRRCSDDFVTSEAHGSPSPTAAS